MKQKYIMTDKGFLIFSAIMSHSQFKHLHPTSAGFCEIYPDVDEDGDQIVKVSAFGESFTLYGMKSKPKEDSEKMTRAMNSCF